MSHQHVRPRPGESRPFHFEDRWAAAAGIDAVWAILERVEQWPQWWPGFSEAEAVDDRVAPGSRARLLVRTPIGTRLRFVIEVEQVRTPHLISFIAHGDLRGQGIWTLAEHERVTQIDSLWCVTSPRLPVRALRPLSGLMHTAVMRTGERGLTARLADRPPQT